MIKPMTAPHKTTNGFGNDADYISTYSVEHSLQPGNATIDGIEPAEDNHHQNRRR